MWMVNMWITISKRQIILVFRSSAQNPDDRILKNRKTHSRLKGYNEIRLKPEDRTLNLIRGQSVAARSVFEHVIFIPILLCHQSISFLALCISAMSSPTWCSANTHTLPMRSFRDQGIYVINDPLEPLTSFGILWHHIHPLVSLPLSVFASKSHEYCSAGRDVNLS
jgi:hypothetical protein